MSRKTLSLIIILLLLTIVLVVIAISARNQSPTNKGNTDNKATISKKPTPTNAPAHTILSMSPNPVVPTAAGSSSATTVSVEIDTGADNVRAVQLEIAYDPALLTGMTIKPGDFFEQASALPIGGINTKTGRITYAITSSSIKASKSGKGTVAILSFYPVRSSTSASTSITILEKSLVTAVGLGTQSVLKQTSGTIVMLGGAGATLPSSSPSGLTTP